MRISVVVAATVLALAAVAPAGAHTGAIDSDPEQGEKLRRPPAQVSVTFSEPPLPTGMAMVAAGPDGRRPLDPSITGTRLIADWPRQAPAGRYQVTYRVVAADGHPITGELTFTVEGAPGSTPGSTPATDPTSQAAPAAPQADQPESTAAPVWLWVVIAGLLAAALVLVGLRARRGSGSP